MRIANPLYDHAFKYLMSNDRLARKVLSVILDKEVITLELAQQEFVIEDEERQFTLYRLDFKAQIMDEAGKVETVLIELQKSKLPTNTLRFRSYLGLAYSQKYKTTDALGVESDTAYPIISIYIMGYNIADLPIMAAKVDRKVIDLSLKQEVPLQSDFIDLLTHTCYVLQVRRLPAERRTRIERFMTLFNQAWIREADYILDLEDVPEEFKDIAEYLQRPLLDEELRKKLQGERDLEDAFASQEAHIKQLESNIKEERRQKEEALRKQVDAQNALQSLVQVLLDAGKTLDEIEQITGKTKDELLPPGQNQ